MIKLNINQQDAGSTEIFFRRNLPHWQPMGAIFFVTWRLAGVLPANIVQELEKERQRLQNLPKDPKYSEREWNLLNEKKIFAIWDKYLDKYINIQWLLDPRIAKIMQSAFYYYAGKRYSLYAYVIMPNHVHILLKPDEEWCKRLEADKDKPKNKSGPLSVIMHSIRSYTANEANKILGLTGAFWQRETYDHWVRDNKEFERIIYYIEHNPVKAGLSDHPEVWQFSSAYDRVQKGLGPFDKLL